MDGFAPCIDHVRGRRSTGLAPVETALRPAQAKQVLVKRSFRSLPSICEDEGVNLGSLVIPVVLASNLVVWIAVLAMLF
ncbi:hypothetical protein RAH32_12855 [Paracoccus sp. WLY502]|uniref:hypothetical protein n=1 Tax=Paracoccus yibinensis TaxID=3068891 RepID=UPI0027964410|nr:hypothetical protein [Paracoccus sp. WLY502]MDQ1901332.1 hypothetical protein [Paracoccus sp. WLY502]